MDSTPAPPGHLANASALSVRDFIVAKLSSVRHGKNTTKSASSSFVLRNECINVGVFGQGESVVASPLSFHSGYAAMPTIPTDVLSVAQLARLRIEGIVSFRRDGKAIYYSIKDEKVLKLVSLLYEEFCAKDN